MERRRSVSPASHAKANTCSPDRMELSEILGELKKIRGENQDGHSQTKASLDRLEISVKDLKGQISVAEDKEMRHERALWYLLHQEMDLTTRCEDLQNRLQCNNLRIY